MNNVIDFKHKMAAHCETGTLTALLNYSGLKITEPLVFGIANGIFFGYMETDAFPFPTIILRSRPGQIRKNISSRLGIKLKEYKFKNQEKGKQTLDNLIMNDIPVAAQVDFFYMDYMPDWQRVHINVHFIIIAGKKDNKYIISDSYFPKISELDENMMAKARWAGGHMAPKGFLYYPEKVPENIDLKKPIIKGIKTACRNMIGLPVPFIGVKGIYKFANKITEWPKLARDTEHLSHEIMKINILLEDQGTGGAGFRFMYASFLQQASEILGNSDLADMSKRMMINGDEWRNISYFAAKIGKNRDLGNDKLEELSNMIRSRADEEKSFFLDLKKMV
ncbi:MAG: BtrH N-terminal domain-containing protein [Bacteroidota bacterium]